MNDRFSRRKKPIRTVAILGMDGSGKSSTLTLLKQHFGDRAHIQYMGFKDFQTDGAKQWKPIETGNAVYRKFRNIFSFLSTYRAEMLYRYRKAVADDQAELIFFDRYAWDSYESEFDPLMRVLMFLWFKVSFPRPDLVIYLHCPKDVSLERRNDIEDVALFAKKKERMDALYLKKNVLCFDSSEMTQEEILLEILAVLAPADRGSV